MRLVKRADGYYAQFCISVDRIESMAATGTTGLDVGMKEFYTDSNGAIGPNPCFRSKGEKRFEPAGHLLSRKTKGGLNRRKPRVILGDRHFKITRQSYCTIAVKLARSAITSNDVVV